MIHHGRLIKSAVAFEAEAPGRHRRLRMQLLDLRTHAFLHLIVPSKFRLSGRDSLTTWHFNTGPQHALRCGLSRSMCRVRTRWIASSAALIKAMIRSLKVLSLRRRLNGKPSAVA
jgi:hypothetical protein